MILDQPSSTTTTVGSCTATDSDTLTAKSPSSSKQGNIPILCGTLTGSHSKFYVIHTQSQISLLRAKLI